MHDKYLEGTDVNKDLRKKKLKKKSYWSKDHWYNEQHLLIVPNIEEDIDFPITYLKKAGSILYGFPCSILFKIL